LTTYHLRRKEMAIDDPQQMAEIIRGQQYMALALCKDNEPYLVTMNYGFDEERRCFYFHCAQRGKKMDYLAANPVVWGQITEDRGLVAGQCDYAYRTVQFRGRVEFLEDLEAKRQALSLMIEQLESEPEPLKARLLQAARLEKVTVGCIWIQEMTGKRGE